MDQWKSLCKESERHSQVLGWPKVRVLEKLRREVDLTKNDDVKGVEDSESSWKVIKVVTMNPHLSFCIDIHISL